MKTLIAMPCMDTIHTATVSCLLDLRKPPGTRVCLKANSLVYDSRNLISLTAIEEGFDRVLWLDSDMIFPPDLMECLDSDMDEGYDLVTGLYVSRRFPIRPIIYRDIQPPEDGKKRIEEYTDYPKDALFPVAGCGFGAVMTSTELLRAVWQRYGPAFAPYPWAGEDISFCYRANECGAVMACDSRIDIGHQGMMIFHKGMIETTSETMGINDRTDAKGGD